MLYNFCKKKIINLWTLTLWKSLHQNHLWSLLKNRNTLLLSQIVINVRQLRSENWKDIRFGSTFLYKDVQTLQDKPLNLFEVLWLNTELCIRILKFLYLFLTPRPPRDWEKLTVWYGQEKRQPKREGFFWKMEVNHLQKEFAQKIILPYYAVSKM